jgi:hypothetical protein
MVSEARVQQNQRLTPAVRARIEKEAQSLVRDVRSSKRLAARDKRAIQDFLGPLVSASSSETSALRLAVSQAEAFTLGFSIGLVEGPGGGGCPSTCRERYAECLEFTGPGASSPFECVLKWMRCTLRCS